MNNNNKTKRYVRTITFIPDDLWNEIKNILPDEKPENTIGRPIVPYRTIIDGRTNVCPKNWMSVENVIQRMVLVLPVIEDFMNRCN